MWKFTDMVRLPVGFLKTGGNVVPRPGGNLSFPGINLLLDLFQEIRTPFFNSFSETLISF